MAGGGWQHLAAGAKELAGGARAVTASLGKAVVREGWRPHPAMLAWGVFLPLLQPWF